MNTKLIVALGNPGKKYEKTRHNVAWRVFEDSSLIKAATWIEKFKGLYTSLEIKNNRFFFLMPQTYMNLSGESVLALATFYKVAAHDILVMHDDLDLNFGLIAFKKNGGAGGHNGIKSIMELFGTGNFLRLKIGIGRPLNGQSVSDWVLSNHSKEEEIALQKILTTTNDALSLYLNEGFEKASSRYSKKLII